SRLIRIVRAPSYWAERTKLEAGDTVPDVPTARKRSQSRRACFARHSASTGSISSKRTMSGRIGAPHASHAGGGADASGTASSVKGGRSHFVQRVRKSEPWS